MFLADFGPLAESWRSVSNLPLRNEAPQGHSRLGPRRKPHERLASRRAEVVLTYRPEMRGNSPAHLNIGYVAMDGLAMTIAAQDINR